MWWKGQYNATCQLAQGEPPRSVDGVVVAVVVGMAAVPGLMNGMSCQWQLTVVGGVRCQCGGRCTVRGWGSRE